jgi:uncharacterized protein (DUF3820 family)
MTADSEPKIIPFGKYKGRLVDEVLVDDPNYLQWLAGQEWFRAKFNILHQVIINRGAEPEETPDHNAMQVKFLDDDFCLRFVRCLMPDCDTQARNKFNEARAENVKHVAEKIKFEKDALQRTEDSIASREIEQSAYVLSLPSARREQYVAERLNELRRASQK